MAVDDPNDRGQWPNNVGQRRTVEAINGMPMTYTIEDEILHQQSELPEKLLCFQRLRFEHGSYELRLAYYMLGARRYWVWGQYATMIPASDFAAITREAQIRGWLS